MSLSFTKRYAPLVAFCLVSIFPQVIPAQDKDWRPVTAQELAMTAPTVEPDADAEAIFWEVKLDDSDSEDLKRINYVRVKIFNERGREKFSKVDIPFLKGLKVKDVAARVIKPDGSIVELKKEDIFEREILKGEGVKIKAKSFAVPGIEPGVIIEYRYREVFEDAGAKGMRLAFQRDIPVQNLSYYYKPYNKQEPNYQGFNMRGVGFVKDKDGYYLATQKNVPSFKEEPRMPPEDQVRPWMLLQGAGLNIIDVSYSGITFSFKDPSIPELYWGGYSSERAGIYQALTKSNKDLKKAAEEVTAGAASTEEKLRKLYDFCQLQIKNISYDPAATDQEKKEAAKVKSVGDVLKRKVGRAGDITLLFGAMASSLGLEIRPVYMSDRSEMFFDPKMTNENFLHFDAIAVKVASNGNDDDWKFLNPGMRFMPYGMLHWSDEEVWALMVGSKNYRWQKTSFTDYDKSVARRTGKFRLLEDGTLEGDVRLEYSGQIGVSYKVSNFSDSPNKQEEDLKEEIKKRISTAEISAVTVENVTDPDKPFVYTFKIRVPGYAQKTGKRLFLQPGFFEYGENPMFPSATRKYDVYFQYPWSEQDSIEIALPPGYALDNADSPADLADSQKIGSLRINIAVDKDQTQLIYTRKFHFAGGGRTLFPVTAYQNLKNFFDAFQKSDAHTITLKQK